MAEQLVVRCCSHAYLEFLRINACPWCQCQSHHARTTRAVLGVLVELCWLNCSSLSNGDESLSPLSPAQYNNKWSEQQQQNRCLPSCCNQCLSGCVALRCCCCCCCCCLISNFFAVHFHCLLCGKYAKNVRLVCVCVFLYVYACVDNYTLRTRQSGRANKNFQLKYFCIVPDLWW